MMTTIKSTNPTTPALAGFNTRDTGSVAPARKAQGDAEAALTSKASSDVAIGDDVALALSSEAKQRLALEDAESQRLIRKAQHQAASMSSPYDAKKVAAFKTMASNPAALKRYLDGLDANGIAESLQQSPSITFLNAKDA